MCCKEKQTFWIKAVCQAAVVQEEKSANVANKDIMMAGVMRRATVCVIQILNRRRTGQKCLCKVMKGKRGRS